MPRKPTCIHSYNNIEQNDKLISFPLYSTSKSLSFLYDYPFSHSQFKFSNQFLDFKFATYTFTSYWQLHTTSRPTHNNPIFTAIKPNHNYMHIHKTTCSITKNSKIFDQLHFSYTFLKTFLLSTPIKPISLTYPST